VRLEKCVFVLLGVLLVGSTPLKGQTSTSAVVVGTVTDSSGGVIPTAHVSLTNTATGATRAQDTGAQGTYTFPNVAPGAYVITVVRDGFNAATVKDLVLEVNKSYTVNVPLEVGSTKTVIHITTAEAELQTTDATIGGVIGGPELINLPTLSRSAAELLTLQTGATPIAAQGDRTGQSGGTVTGARSDQNAILLDGIDISDIFTAGDPTSQTIVPINVEATEEFRVGVTNPNVTVAAAAGGQATVASRSGTNTFHGSVYWNVQNTTFNANSWDNNTVGNPRPAIHDNRGGFTFAGPIQKDKTFFFMNYEPRRFQTSYGGAANEILVPTASFRNGVIYVGSTAYNLNPKNGPISNACGSGNSSCDPRGVGISPLISSMWNLMPLPNDFSNTDTVGCHINSCANLAGYIFNAHSPIQDDASNVRLDHYFSPKVRFFGRFAWYRETNAAGQTPAQVDLRGTSSGTAKLVGDVATRGEAAVAGLDWVLTSNLVNSLHFGWVRQRIDNETVNEAEISKLLNLPGTTGSTGEVVAVQPGYLNGLSGVDGIGQPIAPPNANGSLHGKNIQISDDLNWIKGTHTIVFGGDIRWQPVTQTGDASQGALSTIRAIPDSINVLNNDLPGNGTVGGVNHLYTSMLGLVNKVDYYNTLDANLHPIPGHPIEDLDTHTHSIYLYAQDSWRIKPNITLTYGLAWGVQTPYTENKGRGMVLVDASTNKPIHAVNFLHMKKASALQGVNYNPTFAFEPYEKLGMSGFWNTDWTDWSPRASIAWSPTADGRLGKLLGNNKTVIRGGYAIVYDRMSGGTLPHFLGQPGSTVTPNYQAPACNLATPSNAGVAGCDPTSADPGVSTFRVGVDGAIPVPAVGSTGTLPFIPDVLQGGNLVFMYDPNFKNGRNYMIDFSIQRELPKGFVMEIGYIGRLGRRLPGPYAVNSMPYMYTDVTTYPCAPNGAGNLVCNITPGNGSGQSFARAFDTIAQILRYSAPGTPIPDQPWFENQLPQGWGAAQVAAGNCPATAMSNTQCFIVQNSANFVIGNLGQVPAGPTGPGLFSSIDNARCGAAADLATLQKCSLINVQQADLQQRTSHDFSNYNAFTATLRNRGWHGLTFDLNYTWSKSLDQGGRTQSFVNGFDDSFNPNAMYGPSYFDRKHVFNAVFDYALPFGKGRRYGGWSVSGIFRANSGLPLVVAQSGFAYGGGLVTSNNVDMIPTGHNYSTGLHQHSTGSYAPAGSACANFAIAMGGGVPDPNHNNDVLIGGGSAAFGLNYFSDPAAAYCSFRPILLTQDTRDGRGNPLRGFGMWNLDTSIGKDTAITERVQLRFSADFFNVFNHTLFVDPIALPLSPTDFIDGTNAGNFGVVGKQFIPANRQSGSRWIQFGLRLSF
jgi:hypothetical protein